MTHTHHLQPLFVGAYARHSATHKPSDQSLIPFLHVPLRERLVLLCLLDGLDSRDMETIKTALPYAKETDVRLTSHRMGEALRRLDEALADPWVWINPGPIAETEGDLTDPTTPFPVPDRVLPADTAKQLRQVFFGCIPIMLFGDGVPAGLATLPLQSRLILYLIAVEESTWREIEQLLECSEWSIRRAIKDAESVLGGL